MDYQLIVIGAGPGGYVAALRAAKLQSLPAGWLPLLAGQLSISSYPSFSPPYNQQAAKADLQHGASATRLELQIGLGLPSPRQPIRTDLRAIL